MADIFSKIIRDYNNELEGILEEKDFSEDVKNLLLSMLYKIENGYDDYKKVKVSVCSKNQFVEELLETIVNRCNRIEIIKPTSDEGQKLFDDEKNCIVDKENGIIKTFQNEKGILDGIIQIRQDSIKINPVYGITARAIEEMLLIGNNVNTLELITDFNGWSWDMTTGRNKNTMYSILYKLLVLLIGNEKLEGWLNNRKNYDPNEMPSNLIISSKCNDAFGLTKEEISEEETDYIEEIRTDFRKRYGEELEKEFFEKLLKLSVLECARRDEEYKNSVIDRRENLKDQIEKMSNNKVFVEELSKQKKEITKQIEQLDFLLNDEKRLKEEYEEKNEKLSNEDKIFSISHYELMVKKERNDKLDEIKQINIMMEPNEFVKIKSQLEEKYKFYKDINIEDTGKENFNRLQLSLEKTFLQCFEIKIDSAEENEEIGNLIYELRYFKLNPLILTKSAISYEAPEYKLINKATENKILTQFSQDAKTNYIILREIFNSRIIDLDTVVFMLKYYKGVLTIKIFDANTDDETKQIVLTQKIELNVRINKKIKIWQ